MTLEELQQLRREKWRLDGNPVRTLEDARAFVDSVGFCLMYPLMPAVLLPTFVGAWNGSDKNQHVARQAFADPGTHEAAELIHHLRRQHQVFESNLFADSTLLLSPSVLPFYYALAGERIPGKEQTGGEPLSQSGRLAWEIFQHEGPLTRQQLQRRLGSDLSLTGVDRALGELWMRLRIVRVDEGENELWESLQRWEPDAVREGSRLSVPVALSGLISQYLEGVVAAEQTEIEDFFSHLVPRSKVKDSVSAMLAARQFSLVNVEHHALVQMAAPHATPEVRQQEAATQRAARQQQRRNRSERHPE